MAPLPYGHQPSSIRDVDGLRPDRFDCPLVFVQPDGLLPFVPIGALADAEVKRRPPRSAPADHALRAPLRPHRRDRQEVVRMDGNADRLPPVADLAKRTSVLVARPLHLLVPPAIPQTDALGLVDQPAGVT